MSAHTPTVPAVTPAASTARPCGDPIVDAVRAKLTGHGDALCEAVAVKLAARSVIGQAKYGSTLTRTDLQPQDWLRHAQEEAMDLANYLQVLISGTPLLTRFSDLQEAALCAAVELEGYLQELNNQALPEGGANQH